ncbi:MAG: bacterioferritin [Actinomycetota bacterium]
MQGSPAIIEFLNEALTAELTAINQYFAHAKLCENWGWMELAQKYREESIEEMQDAEKLIDRILLLDGMPNLQRIGSVRVGETVPEQLQLDKELEQAAIERYRRGVVLALEQGDPGTREMLEGLVVGEESHLDWIETQQSMIADMGVELYLQAKIGSGEG